jgi:transcription elongation factor Elf1
MGTWEQAEDTARPTLRCPLCGGLEFEREQGRIDSRWGITTHKIAMMICANCGLILQFSAGRGIFDFD